MRGQALVKGLLLGVAIGVAGCSGGGGGGSSAGAGQDGGCTGFCAGPTTFLTVTDVQQVIAQAVAEAQARGVQATIAVVDRPGNVLAVFRMGGANNVTITSERTPAVVAPFSAGSLENVQVDSTLAAISKAMTGAYLSSEGNAFTTRTANQIVQENFNPGEINRPSGPLFGVQFSQLACSDIGALGPIARTGSGGNIAPNVTPLGLAADPGGLPLYKNGTPVGGVGVIADGIYGLDLVISDFDLVGLKARDEAIAVAGSVGLQAPTDRRGDRITVDGKTFRFTDVEPANLQSNPAAAPNFAAINGVAGNLVDAGVAVAATAFFNAAGGILAGRAFGQDIAAVAAAQFSGIVAANAPSVAAFAGQAAFTARDAFILTNAAGNANAYIPADSTAPAPGAAGLGINNAGGLNQGEVVQLLASALDIANSARAQIRRPVGTPARVTISVVDTAGAVLGIVRTRDAPIFGTDVSLQKARTAALLSSADAATAIGTTANGNLNANAAVALNLTNNTLQTRVALAQFGDGGHVAIGSTALTDGIAFADRSGGNVARPFFPDGIQGTRAGPFSNPFAQWSPFATGLQLELVLEELDAALLGAGPSANCGALSGLNLRTGNGIQIFPGSVPIYRAGVLIGGIGVSGDGIDQDDMISFLGLHNAGVALQAAGSTTPPGNAPVGIRADQIVIDGVNLRYIQCPQSPFLNSSQQDVCQGK